jgi:hypothetical protein
LFNLGNEEYRNKLLDFTVEVMLVFNEEVVERAETKSYHEVELCMRVKDGVREFAIKDILTVLNTLVLNNIES